MLFGIKSVDKREKKLLCVAREIRLQINWPMIQSGKARAIIGSPVMALGQAKGKLYCPFTFCIFVDSTSKRNVVHLSPV